MQQTSEVLSLLTQIELTQDLAEESLNVLSGQCWFGEFGAKKRIRSVDSRAYRLFLVDGCMVRVYDGITERLQSFLGLSDPVDLFPEARDEGDCVITETPCKLLRIPVMALDAALATGTRVEAIDLDPTEAAFLAELYQLITDNRLELPARPEVALRIQDLASDSDTCIDDLTEIIQRDGTIAGALLHATNSPLFRAVKEILTVRDAVLRLGFRNTRMLTMNLVLRQAFKAKHRATREAMKRIWADSVLCSAYSYLISDVLGILHRERALLAGLVAEIGAVPIIQFIETRDADPCPELIESLIGKLSSVAGVLVINYWGLGEDLVRVAEESTSWSYEAGEPDYASIVIVGKWAMLHSEGRPHPDAAEVPAFRILGLPPPAPGEPIAALADSGELLESLKSMFNL